MSQFFIFQVNLIQLTAEIPFGAIETGTAGYRRVSLDIRSAHTCHLPPDDERRKRSGWRGRRMGQRKVESLSISLRECSGNRDGRKRADYCSCDCSVRQGKKGMGSEEEAGLRKGEIDRLFLCFVFFSLFKIQEKETSRYG